jgi:hypothetical protein
VWAADTFLVQLLGASEDLDAKDDKLTLVEFDAAAMA